MSGPVVRSGVSGESPGAVISGKEDTQKPPIVLIINKSFSYTTGYIYYSILRYTADIRYNISIPVQYYLRMQRTIIKSNIVLGWGFFSVELQ